MSQPGYIPGDFWRTCSTCGFQVRASQSFRTWDNRYVCAEDFEARHPQDFVRGRKDSQNVPDPRPQPVDTFIGPLMTTLTGAVNNPGAVFLAVESTARFESGDTIGIAAREGIVRRTIDGIVSATSLTITQALGSTALEGAAVINYSAVAEADIG